MSDIDIFKGEEVTLKEMMAAREQRSFRQLSLLQKFKEKSLLCATMNIPGPIKSSESLNKAFQSIINLVKEDLKDHIIFERDIHQKTGWEYYCLSDLSVLELKTKMIAVETKHSIGRLMDLDVLHLVNGIPQPISRQRLGFPRRQCYVCQNDAKICSRSRKHSVIEMQEAIAKLIKINH
ncbi:citrate lyase holo-[acyl-carrier protein] synthase [Streptococcus troglodytae]|uniref:citrate lyase holo-[acyl-carrier protein] synthase n=1 Tax=Streptococcus troglodytae TaxID=1111760 RepID=A0A1L7LJ98_9STRE|nr:citrate lyase holo-[acyl-carrier protein] synthase [Streptococcus troglodytae]BAQ24271.1 2-(5''-triphosphoribosyl)-3'-dephosphocoenzyme-Asynthase [Streptococcus troglodytae]